MNKIMFSTILIISCALCTYSENSEYNKNCVLVNIPPIQFLSLNYERELNRKVTTDLFISGGKQTNFDVWELKEQLNMNYYFSETFKRTSLKTGIEHLFLQRHAKNTHAIGLLAGSGYTFVWRNFITFKILINHVYYFYNSKNLYFSPLTDPNTSIPQNSYIRKKSAKIILSFLFQIGILW